MQLLKEGDNFFTKALLWSPRFLYRRFYFMAYAAGYFSFGDFLKLFFLPSSAYCAGLGELMDISRAQKDAQAAYAQETRSFERVKEDIDKGAIKKGQSKKEIGKRYGDPVVSIPEYGTGREKWIYKPAKSSFFAGAKIYIFFDKENKLDEIKISE